MDEVLKALGYFYLGGFLGSVVTILVVASGKNKPKE